MAWALAVTACGVEPNVDTVAVTVLPRVLLDGTVELSDRSGGRVLIEEVVAHAPRARLQSPVAGDQGDVVVTADDPLLFHYELAARTGFGADVGGERVWAVPSSGGRLLVGFAPYRATGSTAADEGADANGAIDAALPGHTAVVHGTIAIETRQPLGDVAVGGFVDDVADADPDGAPADGVGGDVGDADPDGAPADGVGGDVGDADPDGAPADGVGGDVGDADPDGAPADGVGGDVGDADPDGAPADGVGGDVGDADPDGAPAKVDASDVDAEGAPAHPAKPRKVELVEGFYRSVVRVPFSLVLDGAFERSVVLSPDEFADLGADEVLPLDLHLSASELLDAEGLAALDAIAAAALARGEREVTMHVSARTTAAAVGVTVQSTVQRPARRLATGGSRIDVSGRWRDD
ncbi:MAG: hypothetical protein FJ137_00290 [Deltaproteobacteria bacterium]|nr:hypothetical protein [Deltaproteobacteria bacterium]